LTKVTDPAGNVTTYVPDDFGQVIETVSPVTGTTRYEFDTAGNLVESEDANNATTIRTYDSLNRLLSAQSKRLGDPDENVTYLYDDTSISPYGIGRLSRMVDPSGSTTYRYQRLGLIARETQVIAGESFVTSHQYDRAGNRTKLTYPSGRVVDYTYDYAGRPLTAIGKMTNASTTITTTYVSDALYYPFGPLWRLERGSGISTDVLRDQRYAPSGITHRFGLQLLVYKNHVTDAAGNVTAITDELDHSYDRSFTYDDLNRLTLSTTGTSLWGAGIYSYDDLGNMKSSVLGPDVRLFSHYMTTPKLTKMTENGVTSAVDADAVGNVRYFSQCDTCTPAISGRLTRIIHDNSERRCS
jgi:YD repeat-containing protein